MDEKCFLLSDKYSIADCVQRWGNCTSIALLDSACNFFTIPSINGVIGYRMESKCAVAFGDPVCLQEDIPQLTQAFHDYCKQKDKNIVYIATSERFMHWIVRHKQYSALAVGDELILDPSHDPKAAQGRKASMLRNKYNQSTRNGIVIKEYTGYDTAIEQGIEAVRSCWLGNRQGPQIYFYRVTLFDERVHKRWFYAEYKGEIVGALVLNKITAYEGWVLNVLMLSEKAPNTTSEFMILLVLTILREEGCRFFSVGATPAAQLGRIEGLNAVSAWLARKAFLLAKKIFHLNDRQRYWRKFQPRTEPSYVLLNKPYVGFSQVLAIMRALNASL